MDGEQSMSEESNNHNRKESHVPYRQYKMRLLTLIFFDAVTICVSYFLALWLRFESISSIPAQYIQGTLTLIPLFIVTYIIVYYFMHLYQSVWRYASVVEAYHIVLTYVLLAVILLVYGLIFPHVIPTSCLLMGYLLSGIFCVMLRFGYRLMRYMVHRHQPEKVKKQNVMIIGAGQTGKEIMNDFRMSNQDKYKICVLVDDNPTKQGRFLEGIKIEGTRKDIPDLVKKYEIDLIIFAIPTASHQARADILNICKETGCQIKVVPGLYQIANGEINVTKLRDVEIDDLLGRDEIHINMDEIKKALHGRIVMVTGGGGSIGSELCRQIAAAGPKQLIIFDIYENNAYAIQQELIRKYQNNLNLVTLIGSVRDTGRINSVLDRYHPDVIFHAAAHKHVPLMENSPAEAIKNNVIGTYNMALAAANHHVGRFLLISTDKAVNPTNAMGASKRLCEMVIQMMSRKHPETVYMAVRFGNVLGSNGSVIPLFKKQIKEGGPVTITDPNIIRYFMTIPEAVSLVLQASYYAKGGEIFVLDMGKPVKIDDMARNLIKLSGLKPDEDIKIVYTGLRPGEKLYEELLMDEEGMTKTKNKLIYIGHPIEMNDDLFMDQLKRLNQAAHTEPDPMEMKRIMAEAVPTYHPDLEHADQAQE